MNANIFHGDLLFNTKNANIYDDSTVYNSQFFIEKQYQYEKRGWLSQGSVNILCTMLDYI